MDFSLIYSVSVENNIKFFINNIKKHWLFKKVKKFQTFIKLLKTILKTLIFCIPEL